MHKKEFFSIKNNSNPNLEESVFTYMKEKNQVNLSRVMEEGKRLVYYFAGHYCVSVSREDLIQAGYEGLLKAVKRFNPEMGVSFSTYACHYIKGEIRHYIRKESLFYRPGFIVESFKLPVEDKLLLSEAFGSLSRIQKEIIYLLFFEEYTQKQVGEKLGINQRKVSRILHKGLKQLWISLTE
ncbi:sigma-70 family RNA polymerase sigma factor [Candidatus Contubernalis alkaliaceticus]|uniref:sigma-70 family RNA polymerase sigma factor n=1 Tax=Candidatus Contubernalis alkaliaceticus TaxID=338645 RepID=UPI001F4BD417|nr:sigma-70 family RNA polymerase sigma factor [Candidatus Contubernalis alkalaceticus]UNC92575.1 sigma-70 family RNA polymerase sigma factor [Candidatus Contubernalis alkalaceticus]